MWLVWIHLKIYKVLSKSWKNSRTPKQDKKDMGKGKEIADQKEVNSELFYIYSNRGRTYRKKFEPKL